MLLLRSVFFCLKTQKIQHQTKFLRTVLGNQDEMGSFSFSILIRERIKKFWILDNGSGNLEANRMYNIA